MFRFSATSSVFPCRSYRFLEMIPGEVAVLGVVIEHRAELKVRSGLYSLWRLELKYSLETVHAEANFRRTWSAEMFGKTKQRKIPGLRGLSASRHFDDNNNKNNRGLSESGLFSRDSTRELPHSSRPVRHQESGRAWQLLLSYSAVLNTNTHYIYIPYR